MAKQSKSTKSKTFADYKPEGHNWITLATGEYYRERFALGTRFERAAGHPDR